MKKKRLLKSTSAVSASAHSPVPSGLATNNPDPDRSDYQKRAGVDLLKTLQGLRVLEQGGSREKQREGAHKAHESVRRKIREQIDPLVRVVWGALTEIERTPAGLRYELKSKHGVNRSETQLRRDLRRLKITIR